MKKKSYIIFFTFLLVVNTICYAENIDKNANEEELIKNYNFLLFSGNYSSYQMNEMNTNYLSTFRLINRGLEAVLADKKLGNISILSCVQAYLPLFTYSIPHVESVRSILTSNNIGSISNQMYTPKCQLLVNGVSSNALADFYYNNKIDYIRMCEAGIESDYNLMRRSEKVMAFNFDKINNVYFDYYYRTIVGLCFAALPYSCIGDERGNSFCSWLAEYCNFTEDTNDFLSDVKGFGLFNAVKAMIEPDAEFKRYVTYSDLNSDERKFIHQRYSVLYLSNLISPFLFKVSHFSLVENISLTGSMAYLLAPFGDIIEENIYLQISNVCVNDAKLNFHLYLRQNCNKNMCLPEFGVELIEFWPLEWLGFNAGVSLWCQPENLNYYSSSSNFGGALNSTFTLFLPVKKISESRNLCIKGVGLSFGFLYKTAGYMSEVEELDSAVLFNIGMNFKF